jgi:hypothetical protein
MPDVVNGDDVGASSVHQSGPSRHAAPAQRAPSFPEVERAIMYVHWRGYGVGLWLLLIGTERPPEDGK